MTIPRNLSFLAEGASSTGVLSVAKGGTGNVTLTAGYIPYGNGISALNSSSNLTFDGTNLAVSGSVTSTNSGVYAAGSYGFYSTTFTANSRNPIWRFGNADAYGLSYFQGSAGYGSTDVVGIHFGTATAVGSTAQFLANGAAIFSGYCQATIFSPTGSTVPSNGMFYPATNTLGFSTNNSEKVRLFSSGGVSIGNTTDPGASNLSVTGTGNFGGKLGVNKASPSEFLEVGGAIRSSGAVSANATGGILAYQGSSVTMLGAWGINSSTRGQIQFYLSDSAGGIGGEYMRLQDTQLSVQVPVITPGYTVATLPTGVTGMRAYVTNALSPSYGSTVVGGGSVTIPVFYNGTNWIVA